MRLRLGQIIEEATILGRGTKEFIVNTTSLPNRRKLGRDLLHFKEQTTSLVQRTKCAIDHRSVNKLPENHNVPTRNQIYRIEDEYYQGGFCIDCGVLTRGRYLGNSRDTDPYLTEWKDPTWELISITGDDKGQVIQKGIQNLSRYPSHIR